MPAPPVTPDVIVRRAADGGWLVELNPGSLPRVLVNNTYAATLKSNTRDREARRYISDRIDAANWLVRALQQRATTILKVATEIVRPAERVLRTRHPPSAAADAARSGGRDLHA